MVRRIKYYEYKTINGKTERVLIKKKFLQRIFANSCLYMFKKINHKHINNKDDYGRNYVNKINDIRGIRTCAYEEIGGTGCCIKIYV